jgi:cytoskeletal protein CcmA (bactofilin family)
MFRRGDDERHDGPIQPREVRRGADGAADLTVVGPGAQLEGTVVSTGSLRIDGEVRGKISAEGDVILTKNSTVEADIHAANVLVGGRFSGTIVSKGRTELSAGGRVEGNITCASLVIAEGAMFSGQSVMESSATSPSAAAAQPAPAGDPEQGAEQVRAG